MTSTIMIPYLDRQIRSAIDPSSTRFLDFVDGDSKALFEDGMFHLSSYVETKGVQLAVTFEHSLKVCDVIISCVVNWTKITTIHLANGAQIMSCQRRGST